MMQAGEVVVMILWYANPFRADKFEDAWRPAAQAALDHGATSWTFFRSMDDPNNFIQTASFPSKKAFDAYWYAEEIAEAHQLMYENKHSGKIAILVGATESGQGKTAEGPGAIMAEVGA